MESLKCILESVASVKEVYAGSREKLGYILELVDSYTHMGIKYEFGDSYSLISYSNSERKGSVIFKTPETTEVFVKGFMEILETVPKDRQNLLLKVSDLCYETMRLPKILEGDPRVHMEVIEHTEKLACAVWVLEDLLGGKWELNVEGLGTTEAEIIIESMSNGHTVIEVTPTTNTIIDK